MRCFSAALVRRAPKTRTSVPLGCQCRLGGSTAQSHQQPPVLLPQPVLSISPTGVGTAGFGAGCCFVTPSLAPCPEVAGPWAGGVARCRIGLWRVHSILPALLTVPPSLHRYGASPPPGEPAHGGVLQWDCGLGVEHLLDPPSVVVEGPGPPLCERRCDPSGCPSAGMRCLARPEPAPPEQSRAGRAVATGAGVAPAPPFPAGSGVPAFIRASAPGAELQEQIIPGDAGGARGKWSSPWVEMKPCAS